MTMGIGGATEQPGRPEGRIADQELPPTLDRVVAEHGPLPEPAVREIGERLAAALAAVHALRQVFGDLRPETVLMYSDGPRLGQARPSEGTADPAGDVYALATVLVFAATGRAPSPGLDAVPAGLRTVLAQCLFEDPVRRPTAVELTAALAGAPVTGQPARVSPEPGYESVGRHVPEPATTRFAPDAVTEPVNSQYAPAQSDSPNRLPWMIAAVCGALVVAVLAIVGIVVAQRGDDSAGGGAGTAAGGAAKYTAAGIGEACALLDMPAAEKVIGKSNGTPLGDKIELPSVADSLECNTMNEHGFIMLHLEVSDQLAIVRSLYDSHRADGLGTTGSGVTTQKVSGIGEDAYLVVHEPNKGDTTQIGCMLGFLEANVVAIVDVYLSEDDGTNRDQLVAICRHQSETVLGRLK
ncbi:hypothetical protein AB0L82_22410 [Nocardia sp. NPDC052001]|uniref:hypothetical protein n=1 Tax=Nocardia sp. NPDC052001 TaxID=3154853 RepID=UPI003430586C